MAERPHRLEVPLNEERNTKLEEDIIGRDEDGNLKRHKTDKIRELIDKEAAQEWHLEVMRVTKEIIKEEQKTDYRFDIEEWFEEHGLSSEDYVFDMQKVVEKVRKREN